MKRIALGTPSPDPPARRPHVTRAADRRRAIAAWGCGVALVMTFSPWLDAAADRSFAWHMAQHILLMYVAAPLLLLAWPARTMLRALPAAASRRVARVMHSGLLLALQHPVVAWLAFASVLWGAHFSSLYEDALANSATHEFEHALFFAAALCFWQPVVGQAPAPWRLAYPLRMAYVMSAVPVGAFLGLALVQTTRVLYPHYISTQESTAAAIADQHAGGAWMWIAGGLVFFSAFMLAGVAWARDERRLGGRLDAHTASAPVIPIAHGSLLRRRAGGPDTKAS